ncbi:hypothetical protein LTR64_001307 [Lithohypha guttulata]|uniref:uncharacterized protein n=1 Tax=Lithohypha guttulata TaxID=1690604 RepID=UPI002DE035AC|nr:hypothetical protein LTR51_003501 [Lithohypha guttulata]
MSHSIPPRKPHRTQSHTASTPAASFPSTPIPDRAQVPDYISHDEAIIHISPTKARVQQQVQHEITQITSWLEDLLGTAPGEVPAHLLKWQDEVSSASSGADVGLLGFGSGRAGIGGVSSTMGRETSEVLVALKALRQVNLAADHLKSLVDNVKAEEVQWRQREQDLAEQQKNEGMPARLLMAGLRNGLACEGQDALNALSSSVVMLGVDLNESECENGEDLAGLVTARLFNHAQRQLVLRQQVEELQVLARTASATTHFQYSKSGDMEDTHDEEFDHTRVQTAQMNRDTKQINLKVMEYEERIKGIERQLSTLRNVHPRVQHVLDVHKRVLERTSHVQALQVRLAAFGKSS